MRRWAAPRHKVPALQANGVAARLRPPVEVRAGAPGARCPHRAIISTGCYEAAPLHCRPFGVFISHRMQASRRSFRQAAHLQRSRNQQGY